MRGRDFGSGVSSRASQFPLTTNIPSFGSSIVTIKVGLGPNQQTFNLHESILHAHSQHFRDLLTDAPLHDGQKVVVLKDVDPTAFALYTQYIYANHIPTLSPSADEYTPLTNLYTLATFFADILCQNASCDAIYSKATSAPTCLPAPQHIDSIYNEPLEPCPARRLMVDVYMCYATEEDLCAPGFPECFMADLARGLVRGKYAFKGVRPRVHYHRVVEGGMFET